MRSLEEIVALLAEALFRSRTQRPGTGRVHEGDVHFLVDGHDRRGNVVDIVDRLLGILHGRLGLGDVEHELHGAGDLAPGVLDGRGGVSNRQVQSGRIGRRLAGEHAVPVHGLGATAFGGLAVRSLEQIITLLAHALFRRGADHAGSRHVHRGDIEVPIDTHHGRRKIVHVLDAQSGGLRCLLSGFEALAQRFGHPAQLVRAVHAGAFAEILPGQGLDALVAPADGPNQVSGEKKGQAGSKCRGAESSQRQLPGRVSGLLQHRLVGHHIVGNGPVDLRQQALHVSQGGLGFAEIDLIGLLDGRFVARAIRFPDLDRRLVQTLVRLVDRRQERGQFRTELFRPRAGFTVEPEAETALVRIGLDFERCDGVVGQKIGDLVRPVEVIDFSLEDLAADRMPFDYLSGVGDNRIDSSDGPPADADGNRYQGAETEGKLPEQSQIAPPIEHDLRTPSQELGITMPMIGSKGVLRWPMVASFPARYDVRHCLTFRTRYMGYL